MHDAPPIRVSNGPRRHNRSRRFCGTPEQQRQHSARSPYNVGAGRALARNVQHRSGEVAGRHGPGRIPLSQQGRRIAGSTAQVEKVGFRDLGRHPLDEGLSDTLQVDKPGVRAVLSRSIAAFGDMRRAHPPPWNDQARNPQLEGKEASHPGQARAIAWRVAGISPPRWSSSVPSLRSSRAASQRDRICSRGVDSAPSTR